MSPSVPFTAADPSEGIALYLKHDETVAFVTGGRVFRPELPKIEVKYMPRSCAIVRPAGGGNLVGSRDFLPVTDSRLDVVCYGSSRLEAESVARECARALKTLTLSKWGHAKLYWARIAGNPNSVIDPETNWPFAVVVTQVMHGIIAA